MSDEVERAEETAETGAPTEVSPPSDPMEPTEPAEATSPEPPPPSSEAASPAQPRRLTRSRDDRVIAGVCGGVGEYLGVDPVLVRIAALVLVFAGGAGILLYIVGWIAMPEPEVVATAVAEGAPPPAATEEPEQRSGALVLGLVFVALGAFFLVDEIWPDFLAWKYIWPIALIAVGLAIVLRPRR